MKIKYIPSACGGVKVYLEQLEMGKKHHKYTQIN